MLNVLSWFFSLTSSLNYRSTLSQRMLQTGATVHRIQTSYVFNKFRNMMPNIQIIGKSDLRHIRMKKKKLDRIISQQIWLNTICHSMDYLETNHSF